MLFYSDILIRTYFAQNNNAIFSITINVYQHPMIPITEFQTTFVFCAVAGKQPTLSKKIKAISKIWSY